MKPSQDYLQEDLAWIRRRGDSLWRELRGQSLFVTGGTGLFGSWFLQSMIDANRELGVGVTAKVLTRDPREFQRRFPHVAGDKAIGLIKGDVADFDLPSGTFTHVLHMATTSAAETFRGEDPLRKLQTLVRGTERTLELAARCGARRLVFTSSGVAYGSGPGVGQGVAEEYSGAPDTTRLDAALGTAKRCAEYLCTYYSQKFGFDSIIARCFSFVGPNLPLDLHYAIGNFIRDALWKDQIVVRGDGSQVRSYLYTADLVVWLLALLVRGTSCRLYNVGSDEAIGIRELAELVRDEVSPAKAVRVDGEARATVGNFSRDWYVPNIARAREELGVDVFTPLRTAVRRAAGFARGQRRETLGQREGDSQGRVQRGRGWI